jgi:hypothetical protein
VPKRWRPEASPSSRAAPVSARVNRTLETAASFDARLARRYEPPFVALRTLIVDDSPRFLPLGGRIDLASPAGGGTMLRVTLPV